MTKCCKCNTLGSCSNCSCVKNGTVCDSCVPRTKNKCKNNGVRRQTASCPVNIMPSASDPASDGSGERTEVGQLVGRPQQTLPFSSIDGQLLPDEGDVHLLASQDHSQSQVSATSMTEARPQLSQSPSQRGAQQSTLRRN